MPLRTCTVVIHDLNQTAHSLDVTAETFYEAVAQALAVLSEHDWVDEIGKGLTTVTIRIRHPEVTGEMRSFIFGPSESCQHGNFHPASYRNIGANPAWARRLTKVHTGSRKALPTAAWRWMELDCANSSDALLMNIFCYRRTVANHALSSLLGVAPGLVPEFGFRPRIPLRNGKTDRTEIDMKLGDLMVEAKLTETNFQTAPAGMIERYRDVEDVLDLTELPRSGDAFPCYQLIRGVLAACATGGSFCVFCDARRRT